MTKSNKLSSFVVPSAADSFEFSGIKVELLNFNEENDNEKDMAHHFSTTPQSDHDHLKQCIDILKHKNLPTSPPAGSTESWCPVVYDKILCWPAASATSTVTLPCPSSHGLDPSRFVFKTCGSDGRWAGKSPSDFIESLSGYTDYSLCLSNDNVYGKKYEIVVPPIEDNFFAMSETATIRPAFVPQVRSANLIDRLKDLTTLSTSSISTTTSHEEDTTTTYLGFITETASNDLPMPKLYNVKHLQLSGLILSLIAIFILTLALIILKKVKLRVNQIRLHVIVCLALCLVLTFIRDLYIVKYYSQEIPPPSLNTTLIVLYALSELFKTFVCVWVFIECFHYFLFAILTGWEQVSFWCYAGPGFSFPPLLTVVWVIKVYFSGKAANSASTEGFVYFQETNREYWILRSFFIILFIGALLLLLLAATAFRSEKSSDSKCKRNSELGLTLLAVILTMTFILLPSFNAPCSAPASSFAGCITCFFVYFYGFFMAIIYAFHQIISPWTEYLIVHPDHKNRLVL